MIGASLSTGCAGRGCDALPAAVTTRAEARAAYLELVRSGASPERTAEADDALHELERRTAELEDGCR